MPIEHLGTILVFYSLVQIDFYEFFVTTLDMDDWLFLFSLNRSYYWFTSPQT
jgi:hypothetical protein